MGEQAIPVLRVTDAVKASRWYQRLGFQVEFEHRFGPGLPVYMGIRRGEARIHLSEHTGDARPGTLVYLWVDDIDVVAMALDTVVETQPWARELEVSDPDGNRLRVGQSRMSEGPLEE